MNTRHENLLTDRLQILPEEIECFIQAPSLENETIQNMMAVTEYDYYKLLRLSKSNRNEFINQELANSIGDYIQNIQIKQGSKLLFEGFDGIEYGTISKSVIIPEWFKEKYVPDTCMISNEW